MKYMCQLCGWIYDEDAGNSEIGAVPGTKFEDLPDDFECLLCFVSKNQFAQTE